VKKDPEHGKRNNHKMKPYIVLQYLLKYTDENHTASATDIIDFLKENDILAERRSIYRDIEEINRVNVMQEEDCTLDEADEMIAEDEELKLVHYDKNKKGFYIKQRHYNFNDIRLLAECVYSAKFLSKKQAKRLSDVVCGFVSDFQAEKIQHDALLTDRVKTANNAVFNNIAIINDAMSKEIDGEKHVPEKISFNYLKYTIADISQQVTRRHGEKYFVSPYKLLINDGNYYLLAFDDRSQKMRTYRVDRMKDVSYTGEPREGAEAFAAIDMKTYTTRVFSMFGGKQERVTMQFINPLLDAVVDRFGNERGNANYYRADDNHFCVSADIEISDQFYGWILGFGNKAKILGPNDVVQSFKKYLDKVQKMY